MNKAALIKAVMGLPLLIRAYKYSITTNPAPNIASTGYIRVEGFLKVKIAITIGKTRNIKARLTGFPVNKRKKLWL